MNKAARRRKKSISIIGAGRMGTALARALNSSGYEIEAVVARRRSQARRAAALTGAHPLALTPRELERLPPSDILLITTPDDAIESVAETIAEQSSARVCHAKKSKKAASGRRVALHTSGALSSTILRSLKRAGFTTASMHPLVSVSEPVHGAESLRSAFFCLEGERAAVGAARLLVRALGAESFSINAKEKALYHAAAVMVSGHLTALFDIAVEMLAHCGLEESRARAILLPLVTSAISNLATSDAAHALTGTFARADVATVRRHLAALHAHSGLTDALNLYVLLGRRSLRLAQAAGANIAALDEIARTLSSNAADELS